MTVKGSEDVAVISVACEEANNRTADQNQPINTPEKRPQSDHCGGLEHRCHEECKREMLRSVTKDVVKY